MNDPVIKASIDAAGDLHNVINSEMARFEPERAQALAMGSIALSLSAIAKMMYDEMYDE